MGLSLATQAPLNLEERFTEPPGWRWHHFERDGRHIRFGSAFPQDSIPDAVVVCLQGVGEFSEKYFETARWCLDHNLAFWTFDWMGQGKSARYLKNPHKRHSSDFNDDIKDLHYFILEYIKHSSVHPDKGRIPIALMAHSYGAHIGLRFLMEYPDFFECAAFSAPLVGIKAFENTPPILANMATSLSNIVMSKSYVPGGGPWEEETHAAEAKNILSGDPSRAAVHNAWCLADPELQVGSVTLGWLHKAQISCNTLQTFGYAENIKTPCILGIPGYEHLVDNNKSRLLAQKIPKAEILELPESYHEILMEKDEIRNAYLEKFYTLVKETIIDRPETLKPF